MLSDLFILHGVPEHIRSDNELEFVATALQVRPVVVDPHLFFEEPDIPTGLLVQVEQGYDQISRQYMDQQ